MAKASDDSLRQLCVGLFAAIDEPKKRESRVNVPFRHFHFGVLTMFSTIEGNQRRSLHHCHFAAGTASFPAETPRGQELAGLDWAESIPQKHEIQLRTGRSWIRSQTNRATSR
jgi:hypothetical protein